MAEYIKREDAVDAVSEIYYDTPAINLTMGKLEVAIGGIPAADVAPVAHGEWKELTNCSNSGVYCSVCHKKVYAGDCARCNNRNKIRSKFCPNCGAKMDGGEK